LHFGASAERADARRRDAGDAVPSSRSGNAADARPPPRPFGLRPAGAQSDHERNKVEASGPDIPFLKRDIERARQMLGEGIIVQSTREDAEKNYELAVNRRQQAIVNIFVPASLNEIKERRDGKSVTSLVT
jgi:hypothetical protein